MDKYKQQQLHESDLWRGKPMDEGRRRTKARKENKTTKNNGDDSKHLQPRGGIGGGSRGRSLRLGFDPLTSVRCPNLPPRRVVNEKKAVNWRLACFMANEYLTRGTLLGTPWLPQDPNPKYRHETNDKSKPRYSSLDQNRDESRREKEIIYDTVTDFLRAGDIHLPGIVNPSQLAAWLGLN